MSPVMSPTPLFDAYATSYDDALNHALAVTGSDKDHFCKERLAWLACCLRQAGVRPRTGLDYGCGNGSSTPLLAQTFNLENAVGVDVASKIIDSARARYAMRGVRFSTVAEHPGQEEFDIAYCNGVFHHIPKSDRPDAIAYVHRCLRPGAFFSLWENNPWSPAARYVMSRCEFDKDAVMLTPGESRMLLAKSSFEIVRTDFLFVFPEFLRVLRPLERMAVKAPIGAQYQVLARKSPAA